VVIGVGCEPIWHVMDVFGSLFNECILGRSVGWPQKRKRLRPKHPAFDQGG